MTTYKKLTWDSYKIQVESAVRDGNGATISTTYATKTELTTGLGTKLDTSVAASTYLTITNAASTYLSKTDGVTTNTAQTITATKSFIPGSGSGTVIVGINAGDSSTARTNGTIAIKTNSGDRAYFNNYEDASNIITQLTSLGHTAQNLEIISNKTSNEGFAKCPYRTYNSANIYDIVTIGSLAANPNVVHTIGAETIYGGKIFRNATYFGIHDGCLYTEDLGNGPSFVMSMPNGNNAAYLTLHMNNDGTAYLNLVKKAGGTFTSTTIATL